MIGQTNILNIIDEQIFMDEFPRFSIITGPKGSGKKTLANYIVKQLNIQPYIVEDVKVESIRKLINDSYKIADKMVYIISDADTMSLASRNALLKVTEEPPHNAYFIMTVSNFDTVLPTLRSRASVYHMQPYTEQEILEYADGKYKTTKEVGIIADLCETPGDVDKLLDIGITEFYEYVEKVVNNIASVSSANAFKIANQIAFKDSDDGYDVDLFLRAFKSVCGVEMRKAVAENDTEGQMWYSAGIKVVSKALSQLGTSGINKSAVFDIFILDIRREWA